MRATWNSKDSYLANIRFPISFRVVICKLTDNENTFLKWQSLIHLFKRHYLQTDCSSRLCSVQTQNHARDALPLQQVDTWASLTTIWNRTASSQERHQTAHGLQSFHDCCGRPTWRITKTMLIKHQTSRHLNITIKLQIYTVNKKPNKLDFWS